MPALRTSFLVNVSAAESREGQACCGTGLVVTGSTQLPATAFALNDDLDDDEDEDEEEDENEDESTNEDDEDNEDEEDEEDEDEEETWQVSGKRLFR